MKIVLTVLVSSAALVALILYLGVSRQSRSTSRIVRSLVAASPLTGPDIVDVTQLDGLPLPVARYLRHALQDAQPQIQVARLKQVGELRTNVEEDRWSSFEASQVIAPLMTGFVWDARVSIAPLVHVRVRDAYVGGQGSGRVSLLSAIPLASDSGRREIDSGSLHRYLAEAVWYPTALLPSAILQWSAATDTTAMATLTHRGLTVSLEFRFNEVGEVTGIYSPGRWGRFDDAYVQTPWEGHFRDYRERSGMRLPMEGEVGWYSSGEWQPVWRGRLLEASYVFVTDLSPP